MSQTLIHLVVGTPCYRGLVTSIYFSSVLKLQEACQREGISLTFWMPDGGDLIQEARQEIVADFMEIQGATHLLFIDSDISFEPEQVFRLLRFKQDLTAAAYPLKHIDWEKVRAAALAGQKDMESAGLRYAAERVEPPEVREGFMKARSAGTGFLLIKRSVFAAMEARYPELRYSRRTGTPGKNPYGFAFFNCVIDGKDGPYLSEDYGFCRLWSQMGGEIWVDLESRLGHAGQTVFGRGAV